MVVLVTMNNDHQLLFSWKKDTDFVLFIVGKFHERLWLETLASGSVYMKPDFQLIGSLLSVVLHLRCPWSRIYLLSTHTHRDDTNHCFLAIRTYSLWFVLEADFSFLSVLFSSCLYLNLNPLH